MPSNNDQHEQCTTQSDAGDILHCVVKHAEIMNLQSLLSRAQLLQSLIDFPDFRTTPTYLLHPWRRSLPRRYQSRKEFHGSRRMDKGPHLKLLIHNIHGMHLLQTLIEKVERVISVLLIFLRDLPDLNIAKSAVKILQRAKKICFASQKKGIWMLLFSA